MQGKHAFPKSPCQGPGPLEPHLSQDLALWTGCNAKPPSSVLQTCACPTNILLFRDETECKPISCWRRSHTPNVICDAETQTSRPSHYQLFIRYVLRIKVLTRQEALKACHPPRNPSSKRLKHDADITINPHQLPPISSSSSRAVFSRLAARLAGLALVCNLQHGDIFGPALAADESPINQSQNPDHGWIDRSTVLMPRFPVPLLEACDVRKATVLGLGGLVHGTAYGVSGLPINHGRAHSNVKDWAVQCRSAPVF